MASRDASKDPRRPAAIATREVLRGLVGDVLAEIPGTLEGTDPEHLHDLRIAVRRTRSVLRELRDALPSAVVATQRELFGRLADATSEPRDLDVLVLEWEDQLGGLPLAVRQALGPARLELEQRRDSAYRNLRRELESPATTAGLAAWADWLDGPEGPGDAIAAGEPIGVLVGQRVLRLHKHLLRAGRAITEASPGDALHSLRKDGKRLRYVVDGFSPLFAGGPRKRFVARLKALQDHLGAHQDAEVRSTHLHGMARRLNDGTPVATDLVFALGRLTEQADRRRRAERHAFAKVFDGYDSRRTAELLHELVGSAR